MAKENKRNTEAYNDVKLYIANDWNLSEETPEYYLLKRNTASIGMHFLILCVTVWFTFGILNIVYHLMCNKKKKILK